MAPVTHFVPVVSQLVPPNSNPLSISVIVPPSDRIALPALPVPSPTEKTPPRTQAPESPHSEVATAPPSDPDDEPVAESPPPSGRDDEPVDESPLPSDPDDEPVDESPLPSDPDDDPVEVSLPPSPTASCKFPSTRLHAVRAPTDPAKSANTKIHWRVALDIRLTIVPRRKPRLSMVPQAARWPRRWSTFAHHRERVRRAPVPPRATRHLQ